MRIISPFRDYYDSVQGLGQDQSLKYLRQPFVEELVGRGGVWVVERKKPSSPVPKFLDRQNWWVGDERKRSTLFSLQPFLVGFCGKTVAGIRMRRELTEEDGFFYSAEALHKEVEKSASAADLKKYDRRRNLAWMSSTAARETVDEWFAQSPAIVPGCLNARGLGDALVLPKRIEAAFADGCPVCVGLVPRTLMYHCSLQELDFQKVFPPYQAAQEIQMFLGQQAEPRKPIPPIDDQTMAEIKGFDKFSFRKRKKEDR